MVRLIHFERPNVAVLEESEEIRTLWDDISQLRHTVFSDELSQYEQQESGRLEDPGQHFICLTLNDNLIGYGGLVHINWTSMVAEMSFLLETLRTKNKKNYQNDMKNFISILISIAFDELNFKKITTESFNFRKKTIEVLNDSNFKIDKNANTHLGKQNSVFHSIINRK